MRPESHARSTVITYHTRSRAQRLYSLERVFDDVAAALPAGFSHRFCECPAYGTSPANILRNLWHAWRNRGSLNHITGDVHYLALVLPRSATILTIHDLVSVERLSGWRRWLILLLWYTLPIRHSRVVSVISESTRAELLQHVHCASHKVRVIHDPVSASYRPALSDFHSDCPTVLQVGTKPNKNLDRIALALAGIGCRLRIVGQPTPHQEDILRRAGIDYSWVAGISDEQMAQEYRDCDLLLFASTYEGFGLPIVEAQATGRPVVTSNIMSMPEVAGDAACLVDPFSVQSIRQGVLKVIADAAYREHLIAAGLANVERFRPERIAAQYAALYGELQDARHSRSR